MRRYAERPGIAEFDCCSILLCGGQLASSAELRRRVLWWTVFAGSWLLVEPEVVWNPLGGLPSYCNCVLQNEVLRRNDADDAGASCDIASTRVIHAPCSSGCKIWTRRCSASEQQARDSSSSERYSESHRCERPWRPKEFSGREEDFQQWSKKTEAFFAGLIKESEMMSEWAGEQQLISSPCQRTRMWTEECRTWSMCCSRCRQRSWLSPVLKRMTLSPTRGRTRWKDWSSVGWHEGWEQTHDSSGSSFSLGGLDVNATIGSQRFEWVKMNLDTGAAVNTFPLKFGPNRAGDGRFYRTASGENGFMMVELGSFQDLMKMVCSDL